MNSELVVSTSARGGEGNSLPLWTILQAALPVRCSSDASSLYFRVDAHSYPTNVQCAPMPNSAEMFVYGIGFPEHSTIVLSAMKTGAEVEVKIGDTSFRFSLMGFTAAFDASWLDAARPVTFASPGLQR